MIGVSCFATAEVSCQWRTDQGEDELISEELGFGLCAFSGYPALQSFVVAASSVTPPHCGIHATTCWRSGPEMGHGVDPGSHGHS